MVTKNPDNLMLSFDIVSSEQLAKSRLHDLMHIDEAEFKKRDIVWLK